MKPTAIKKISPAELKISWEDGKESIFPIQRLRDNCPCAGCSGETVLLREYHPAEPDRTTPGRYELTAVQLVGSYAIQLTWGDGHNTGIYTFEFLRKLPA